MILYGALWWFLLLKSKYCGFTSSHLQMLHFMVILYMGEQCKVKYAQIPVLTLQYSRVRSHFLDPNNYFQAHKKNSRLFPDLIAKFQTFSRNVVLPIKFQTNSRLTWNSRLEWEPCTDSIVSLVVF